jgi:hypothetical protein
MDTTRERLARQDGVASVLSMILGIVLLGVGGLLWVGSGARDAAAVGHLLVLLALVPLLASVLYGISSRWWRYGGRGE